ncbi:MULTISPECIES: UDP-N-acetylmuramate:L-alanyl-gamma-D-glutamyl-meso-diaminopimelate ligase [Candidatus Ichthyocystis]|uniref:UDP-N-acetylmuramate: L-alanyl-gamma-D-glutamyl-meso-diaminopimelate ligase n=1 Tax=Candidatus Ichthyocystis hellenicum TaxID=1561003 RepID=A0A0S4M4D5_9BURK|nr:MULTISPECIES: UDP-N-acetylmuramate:L-alanyl-gamma-D-glutamyl-meso-diaminopimelate ligase [Ichthyocystis]CUT17016.1 UDP-N-acetylmuramate: L-alanyl-gamma-D-glutamyl-meso-diaminopimelate ligase [Candidatus Ichthyocystis hellenicum]
MHIHILGIAGVLMSNVARLAIQCGHTVTGSDIKFYPPVVDALTQLDIHLIDNFDIGQLNYVKADLYLVGNVMCRGMPIIEEILNKGIPYTSAPKWLGDNILIDRHVLAVSGTHGKTTTAAMLTWILLEAGLAPGFLIGGIPRQITFSADKGESDLFVIEADEYDTAFFDKRSKFIHYHPKTLLINNLEYDHADIFRDLEDMTRQYHFLIRTLSGSATIIYPNDSNQVNSLLNGGCWSNRVSFSKDSSKLASYSDWTWTRNQRQVIFRTHSGECYSVSPITGDHNCHNALAAFLMAVNVGVSPEQAANALSSFRGVKRRLECILEKNGIRVFDDFAHHPTALKATISAAKELCSGRLWVVFEPSSNSFKRGLWADILAESLVESDYVMCYLHGVEWDVRGSLSLLGEGKFFLFNDIEALLDDLLPKVLPGDDIIIMSNGFFAGIGKRIMSRL